MHRISAAFPNTKPAAPAPNWAWKLMAPVFAFQASCLPILVIKPLKPPDLIETSFTVVHAIENELCRGLSANWADCKLFHAKHDRIILILPSLARTIRLAAARTYLLKAHRHGWIQT